MSEAYKEALKALARADKAADRATQKLQKARDRVEEERGKLIIRCRCDVATPVKDIPFISETRSTGWEDHEYSYHNSWVCPACGDEFRDLDSDPFPEGIRKYVDKVHAFFQRETGEVRELRKRRRDREKQEREIAQKKRRIEAAKELLKTEGII